MKQTIMNAEVLRLIGRDLGLALQENDQLKYQELIDLVAERVAELLDKRPETLFSLLYRLDVDEEKVDQAINSSSNIPKNVLIAELIVNRQMKRIETKLKYKQEDIDGWDKF